MGIMDKYNLPHEEPPVYVSPVFNNSNSIKNIIANVDKISDAEIFNTLSGCIDIILTDNYINSNKDDIMIILKHPKLIAQFARVLTDKILNTNQKTYMNKIIRSAIKNSLCEDEYTKTILYNMIRIANKDMIPQISCLVPDNMACDICLNRYSSFTETTNVKRLNMYLMKNITFDDKTEQLIVNLYDKLFMSVTPLLEGIMFETKEMYSNMTENENEIFGMVGLAILDVLEGMPSQYIYQILSTYSGDYKMLYSGNPVRYSFKSVNGTDYPRILSVISMLENQGIFIP